MRVTRTAVTPTCAICERTLLLGERTIRFAPDAARDEFVEVCPLCQETALEYGWAKEGSPRSPTVVLETRRRPRLARLLTGRTSRPPSPIASEPILRRLSDTELALVEAADLFNSSDYRRTVGGVAKSLGEPRASIVPLRGVNNELVVTVAWDISWYQYRVSPDSLQPVRLAEKGHDPRELESTFVTWNARIEEDGRLVPDIARI
jgi:hypothetical protein